MILNESRMMDVRHALIGTLFKVKSDIFIKTGVASSAGSIPVIYMAGTAAGEEGRRAGFHQQVTLEAGEHITEFHVGESSPINTFAVGTVVTTGLGLQIVRDDCGEDPEVLVWDINKCEYRRVGAHLCVCKKEPQFKFVVRDPIEKISKDILKLQGDIADQKATYEKLAAVTVRTASSVASLAKMTKDNRLALDQHITDDADLRMRGPSFASLWIGLALATPGIIALIMGIASYVESH